MRLMTSILKASSKYSTSNDVDSSPEFDPTNIKSESGVKCEIPSERESGFGGKIPSELESGFEGGIESDIESAIENTIEESHDNNMCYICYESHEDSVREEKQCCYFVIDNTVNNDMITPCCLPVHRQCLREYIASRHAKICTICTKPYAYDDIFNNISYSNMTMAFIILSTTMTLILLLLVFVYTFIGNISGADACDIIALYKECYYTKYYNDGHNQRVHGIDMFEFIIFTFAYIFAIGHGIIFCRASIILFQKHINASKYNFARYITQRNNYAVFCWLSATTGLLGWNILNMMLHVIGICMIYLHYYVQHVPPINIHIIAWYTLPFGAVSVVPATVILVIIYVCCFMK